MAYLDQWGIWHWDSTSTAAVPPSCDPARYYHVGAMFGEIFKCQCGHFNDMMRFVTAPAPQQDAHAEGESHA